MTQLHSLMPECNSYTILNVILVIMVIIFVSAIVRHDNRKGDS